MKLLLCYLAALLSITACGGSGKSGVNSDNGVNRDPSLTGSGENFVNFESGQVRPLALSADGYVICN